MSTSNIWKLVSTLFIVRVKKQIRTKWIYGRQVLRREKESFRRCHIKCTYPRLRMDEKKDRIHFKIILTNVYPVCSKTKTLKHEFQAALKNTNTVIRFFFLVEKQNRLKINSKSKTNPQVNIQKHNQSTQNQRLTHKIWPEFTVHLLDFSHKFVRQLISNQWILGTHYMCPGVPKMNTNWLHMSIIIPSCDMWNKVFLWVKKSCMANMSTL